MKYSAVALSAALVMGLVYLALAIAAFRHLTPEARGKERQRLLALTLWWPFYDLYDARAKNIRRAGTVTLLLCAACWIAWGMVK